MRKFAIVRSQVSIVWPIQHGINVIQKEVSCLEEVGFFFIFECRNNP
jgi:hypothetical protein